jgi:hypothetical protein
MFDINHNGKVDQVVVNYNEPLASSPVGTWSLANVPSGGTLNTGAISISGSAVTLPITEGAGAANTAVGSFTVALTGSQPKDLAGNTAATFGAIAPTDLAPPAVTSMQMQDTNTNGKVDHVALTFSETLASYTAGSAPWTLANVPSGGSLNSVSVSTNTATLNLTEGAGAADTSVGSFTVALATSATGIRDAAGNQSTFAATAPSDGAAPVFTSIADGTGGTNGNGKLEAGDFFDVTFSEPLVPTWTPSATITVTLSGGNGSNNDSLTIPSLTNASFSTGASDYISGNGSTATFANSALTLTNGGATVRVTLGPSCAGSCAQITASAGGSGSGVAFSSALKDGASSTVANTLSWTAFKFF